MNGKRGRLGHGYQIRVEHPGQLNGSYGQLWGIEEDLPTDWDEFQQENIGNPEVAGATIYRGSESRKWMQHRRISDEFVNQ